MNKVRYGIILFSALVVGVVLFAFVKSWFYFNRGVQVVTTRQEPLTVHKPRSLNYLENADIVFNKYLFYPLELSEESGGFGPDELLHRARNLHFINLVTGRKKKIFKNNVYIHDYFPGVFSRQKAINRFESPVIQSLDIGRKFVIIGAETDSNNDGFLNRKDDLKLFVLDLDTFRLKQILPDNYSFENIYYNAVKNRMVIQVSREEAGERDYKILIYNASSGKVQIP